MNRHLISAADLTRADALLILDTADELARVADRPIKKLPTLRGRTVVNLFYEDSTRTRISFEAAAKRLSADVINFSAKGSSVAKGESLKDTAARVLPFFEKRIAPELRAGKNVLVVAHGNSLRALIMQLDRLTPEEVMAVELGTGRPLIYRLNADGTVAEKRDIAA